MKLFNNSTGSNLEVKPNSNNDVTMYFCGPTVYDKIHIGNLRSFMTADLLFRTLKSKFENVIFIRNITDIDEKIINRSKEENIKYEDLTKKYIDLYHQDIHNMNILLPTYEPKVTETMNEIIELIQILINKDIAYVSNGSVYYDITKIDEENKIFSRNIGSGESRIDKNLDKRNNEDFALWKKTEVEPYWESPWSKGIPGWHTECPAMIRKYTQETLSIHGGGIDLQFPHHSNEQNQHYSAYDEDLANIWIHSNMLNIDGKKMSKSEGTKIYISELLEKYHPDIIRYYFLSTKYSNVLYFSYDDLMSYDKEFKKLYEKLKDTNIDKNLDLSEGLSYLYDDLNTHLYFDYIKTKSNGSDDDKIIAKTLLDVLGFKLDGNYYKSNLSVTDIENLLKKREDFKKDKNYIEADKIRNFLNENNIEVNDLKGEVVWKMK